MEIITMYDDDSLDYWMDYDEQDDRRAEAELLRQAQDFDADFYGDPEPTEDDYQDLLDELDYPEWVGANLYGAVSVLVLYGISSV